MGLLRIILALCVVFTHSPNSFEIPFLNGRLAVQTFYIISGFYMTLILKEKYIGVNNSYKLYITNRLMRLFPIYWFVLLLTLFLYLTIFIFSAGEFFYGFQVWLEYFNIMKFESVAFLIFTNIFVIFQDLVMFFGLDYSSGSLFFTNNFRNTDPELYKFLMIPQAWSIGIEILFYVIAPLVVKRNLSVIILLIFLSALLRIFIYSLGLNYDPWSYRFFPTELLFFLLGTISYHIYKNISNNILPKIQLQAILCGAIGFTFFYSYLSFPFLDKVYILFLVVSIPFIFFLTKNSQLDRYIGDLSYPVYISHILIINTLVYLDISILKPSGIIVSIMSILISVLINKFFANKFERYRQNRLLSKQ